MEWSTNGYHPGWGGGAVVHSVQGASQQQRGIGKNYVGAPPNSIIHTRTEQSHPPDFQEKHKKKLRDAFGKKCHQSVVQFRMGNQCVWHQVLFQGAAIQYSLLSSSSSFKGNGGRNSTSVRWSSPIRINLVCLVCRFTMTMNSADIFMSPQML